MIVSGGIVVKDTRVLWTGTPATWDSWNASLAIGNRWMTFGEMYRTQHWVRVCVDKRADLLARLPLKVYEQDALNRPEVDSTHPYAVLLDRPNRRQDRVEFWRWVQSTYDIYGEAFLGKLRDKGGRPNQLVPFHPTAMREVEERDGQTIWDFDNGRVQIRGIPDEDLVHPHNYNPHSLTRGLSKLESLRATLENEDAALRAQSSFWRNGARPAVILSHPGKLSQPAAERLKLRWDAIAGTDNTGATVVLEEGMKPEIIQVTAEEAQYIDARKLNREEVVAAYDLPPPAVHILDHATFSNIREQFESVYRDTMEPVTTAHQSTLERQLRGATRGGSDTPDFGEEVYAEFLLDGVLRGAFEQRADAYQKAINSGWTSPAEVRRAENLPFIEGSDQLFINSTMVPLAVAAEPPDEPEPVVPEIIEAVVVDDEDEEEDDEDEPPNARSILMGRLSRPATLAEINPDVLAAGLGSLGPKVTALLAVAKAAGWSVVRFRNTVRDLGKESR